MTLGDFDRGVVTGVAAALLGVVLGFVWWCADAGSASPVFRSLREVCR